MLLCDYEYANDYIYILELYIPICENDHWHLHVVNIESQRVELLSFMSFGRGNKVPQDSLKLTKYIWGCVKSWGLKYEVEFTKFDHVCADVSQ